MKRERYVVLLVFGQIVRMTKQTEAAHIGGRMCFKLVH